MALDTDRLTVAIEGRITDLEKKMARADAVTSRTYNKMSQGAARAGLHMEKSMGQMAERTSSAMLTFSRGMATSLVAALVVKKIAAAAATYTDLTNTLKVAGLEGEALGSTFRDLLDIAQRNGTAIEPLVTLYSRLSQAQAELGASSEDLTRFTDGIALALRVGGTNAAAASGALLQLSQAMGGAIVRAEEFNSINEGARPILQAVASGLEEAGGSVSKLRSLVIDGKLSSEAFFRAFLAGMPTLQQKASKATETVGQGVTRLENTLTALVGKLDETSGASSNAAKYLNAAAETIDQMPGFIDRAVSKLGALRKGFADVGNLPIWRKLGEFMGIDYSPEGLKKRAAEYGYVPPEAKTARAGSGRRGGATMARAPVETVSINDAPAAGTATTDRAAAPDEYERLTKAIRERKEALDAETAAQAGINPLIDDYGFAIEKARAAHDLLQAAKEAELEITPALRQSIEDLATSYADASVAATKLQESQAEVREQAEGSLGLSKEILGSYITDVRNGATETEALANALGRVAEKLAEIGLNALFDPKGGLGSAILSAFSGGTKVPGFAGGGRIRGPGTGTSDSVLASVSDGEYIVRASQAARHAPLLEAINSGKLGNLPSFANGGFVTPRIPSAAQLAPAARGGDTFHVTMNMPINAPGADAAELARLRAEVAQVGRNVPKQVIKTLLDARKRNIKI